MARLHWRVFYLNIDMGSCIFSFEVSTTEGCGDVISFCTSLIEHCLPMAAQILLHNYNLTKVCVNILLSSVVCILKLIKMSRLFDVIRINNVQCNEVQVTIPSEAACTPYVTLLSGYHPSQRQKESKRTFVKVYEGLHE